MTRLAVKAESCRSSIRVIPVFGKFVGGGLVLSPLVPVLAV